LAHTRYGYIQTDEDLVVYCFSKPSGNKSGGPDLAGAVVSARRRRSRAHDGSGSLVALHAGALGPVWQRDYCRRVPQVPRICDWDYLFHDNKDDGRPAPAFRFRGADGHSAAIISRPAAGQPGRLCHRCCFQHGRVVRSCSSPSSRRCRRRLTCSPISRPNVAGRSTSWIPSTQMPPRLDVISREIECYTGA
jgi:hypothetical protein